MKNEEICDFKRLLAHLITRGLDSGQKYQLSKKQSSAKIQPDLDSFCFDLPVQMYLMNEMGMTFFLASTQQSRANATGEEWKKGAYMVCNILLGCSLLVFHYYERRLKVYNNRYFCVKIPQLQSKKNEIFWCNGSLITNIVLKQFFLGTKQNQTTSAFCKIIFLAL